MDEESAFITAQLRTLEKYIRTLPVVRTASTLSREERDSLHTLQDHLADARKLSHDAATSDDVVVKIASLKRCTDALEQFRQALLRASQFDLVNAVDVAQLSAMGDAAGDLARKQMKRLI